MQITATIEVKHVDEDYSLDAELERRIINKVAENIVEKVNAEQKQHIADSAEKLITAKMEYFLNNFLDQPITINESWNNRKTYDSIYAMVEEKISSLYTAKLTKNKTSCHEDPLLGKIKNAVDNEINAMMERINKRIEKHAKEEATKQMQENKVLSALDAALPKLKTR